MAFINHLIFVYIVSGYCFSSANVATWSSHLLDSIFGYPESSEPSKVVLFVFAFVLLIVYDLANYVDHRLQHRIPILWELRKPHHSALVMTPITALRVHPLSAIFAEP